MTWRRIVVVLLLVPYWVFVTIAMAGVTRGQIERALGHVLPVWVVVVFVALPMSGGYLLLRGWWRKGGGR